MPILSENQEILCPPPVSKNPEHIEHLLIEDFLEKALSLLDELKTTLTNIPDAAAEVQKYQDQLRARFPVPIDIEKHDLDGWQQLLEDQSMDNSELADMVTGTKKNIENNLHGMEVTMEMEALTLAFEAATAVDKCINMIIDLYLANIQKEVRDIWQEGQA